MLRKSLTLEFKLPSCFSFVYAFFIPNFHHMAITHHILRKTRGGGRYFVYQAVCWQKRSISALNKLHFPEKYNKLLFMFTEKIKINKV